MKEIISLLLKKILSWSIDVLQVKFLHGQAKRHQYDFLAEMSHHLFKQFFISFVESAKQMTKHKIPLSVFFKIL